MARPVRPWRTKADEHTAISNLIELSKLKFKLNTPRWSNGRTADSESAYLGSNPSLGTIKK